MTGRRCLIVANQTLGGHALDQAIKDRIRRDVSVFYIVVPMTAVEHETPSWGGGFSLREGPWVTPEEEGRAVVEALEDNARRHEAELLEAQQRAERRLGLMIDKIRSMGGQAEGEVGSGDPPEATQLVLERQASFDEIIVSTLPAGLSRWLKLDLPHRVARMTDVPVTTIEAAEE